MVSLGIRTGVEILVAIVGVHYGPSDIDTLLVLLVFHRYLIFNTVPVWAFGTLYHGPHAGHVIITYLLTNGRTMWHSAITEFSTSGFLSNDQPFFLGIPTTGVSTSHLGTIGSTSYQRKP